MTAWDDDVRAILSCMLKGQAAVFRNDGKQLTLRNIVELAIESADQIEAARVARKKLAEARP